MKIHAFQFSDIPIPMAQVLRRYIQMFPSYRLYVVCIILETAHHRTRYGIFRNITQSTTPEENCQKMFPYFFINCPFSYAKVKDILEISIKLHLGRAKGSGEKGYKGEAQNEGSFCKIPNIKQDTNFNSKTVHQTNFYSPPLQSACPKTYMKGLSSDFKQFFLVSSFSWSKKTLCIFKE